MDPIQICSQWVEMGFALVPFLQWITFTWSLVIFLHSFSVNMVPVWLADNASVFQALRFWTRNFLTVILPFLILAYCNCQIVQQLRKRRRMTMSGE